MCDWKIDICFAVVFPAKLLVDALKVILAYGLEACHREPHRHDGVVDLGQQGKIQIHG